MRRLALILTFLVVLALAGSMVLAQSGDIAIPWFSVSGGGGASDGAVFTLRGTAGQTGAGEMSGGDFAIDGGYWGGFSLPTRESSNRIYLPLVLR